MKIVKLVSENIKKIKAVEITPEGSVVVVGGRNGAGKTSLLDSIFYALAGKGALPSEPIRKGEEKASVSVDLGEIRITRTFTRSGSYLTVENADGMKFKSPQAILDKLTGTLTFDPLEFSRMGATAQVETLKALVGLDFSEMENKRATLYEERVLVNRETKALEGQLQGMPEVEAPAEEVSVAALMETLEDMEESNRSRANIEQDIQEFQTAMTTAEQQIRASHEQVAIIQKTINGLEADEKKAETSFLRAQTDLEDTPMQVTDAIREQIASAEGINATVRQTAKRAEVKGTLAGKKKESLKLSNAILEVDQTKTKAIADAELPVSDLSFDADGLRLASIPFDQCATSEQLRVSVAMGLALNPKLKILLIRDGSLLDEDSLKLVADMAEEADAQVWLEMVGEGDACQVIIEDGRRKEKEER